MGGMIGRFPAKFLSADELSGHEIVRVGAALGHVEQRRWGEEDVVVHDKRPVVDLDEQVLGDIVVEQVLRDARALRHPIEPETTRGAVDVVAADLGVNGGVELDARHLRAGK